MTDELIHLGYLFIFFGTFLEGETILILAAYLAHRGYFNIYAVILVAMAGAAMGDHLFFYIGRRHGTAFLKRRPHWAEKLERTQELIKKHEIAMLLSFRFMYGLRNAIPFALGISGTTVRRFVPLSVILAGAWAVVVALLGHSIGRVASVVLAEAHRYEVPIAIAIVMTGSIIWGVHVVRSRRSQRSVESAPASPPLDADPAKSDNQPD